jgi:hypothetical protein
MTIDKKHQEHSLMENSIKRSLQVQIPGGPLLFCNNCWDYKTNLTETSFKTTSEVDKEHPLLQKELLDLKPIFGKKVWIISILRQPKSKLINDDSQRKPNKGGPRQM